jgi:hypothetical protein
MCVVASCAPRVRILRIRVLRLLVSSYHLRRSFSESDDASFRPDHRNGTI